MDKKNCLVCYKCKKNLIEKEITFEYLGREFSYLIPACPICGQVFISEELINNKIKSVELLMEGK